MGKSEEDFLSDAQNIFGKKEIRSKKDIEVASSEIQSAIDSAERKSNYVETEFDQSLKVDIEQKARMTKYEPIPRHIKDQITRSFENFKEALLLDSEIKGYEIKEQNEGNVKDTPFVSYVELDDAGNVVSTIIATENSASKTTKNNDGSYRYQEVRKTKDGMEAVITENGETFIITGQQITQNGINKLVMFHKYIEEKIGNGPKYSDENMQKCYENIAQSLGVNSNLDTKDKEKYDKIFASTRTNEGIQELYYLFDKENGYDQPEMIIIAREADGKTSAKNYMRTADGKYLDSEISMVDGKPQYNLYTLEELEKDFHSKVDIDDLEYIDRSIKRKKELAGAQLMPDSAPEIFEDSVRAQERAMQIEQEEDLDPNDPYAKHTEHGEL